MKTFSTLYQKTATGAIQQWTISASRAPAWGDVNGETDIGHIRTEWGQVGGAMQVGLDIIKAGKNAGKKNATTAVEQAEKEAAARWLKQKKKGYVESLEAAEAGEVDSTVILGGVAPMLAPNKSYPKDGELVKRIQFPCFVQPKLDGMRCVAVIENGKATLWSRTRKPILTVPHIVVALEERFAGMTLTLDGELYNHDYRNSFEDLISILRKDQPDTEGLHKLVEYHIYDLIGSSRRNVGVSTPFKDRIYALVRIMDVDYGPLKLVKTLEVTSLQALVEHYEAFLEQEYEGAMARNTHGCYDADKRSPHLQKMKPFEDHEFLVTGVNDGRGKDAGTAATFDIAMPCLCHGLGKLGGVGRARLKAPYARRRELMQKPELWQGRALTVTMKRWTSDNVPYLPVAKSFRDYE